MKFSSKRSGRNAVNSKIPIFPVTCPKCGSRKITVVLGTSRRLECLNCGGRFRIVDLDVSPDR
jgi:ribosomal protein S27E